MKDGKQSILKKVRSFFNRHIHGARGAISIFMALVLSPLLSVSLVLVESARYQDAVELMEELNDSAAFSTLAEYDSFLDQRFGLLSVSQEIDINTVFNDYLKTNTAMLGNNVTLNTQSAVGKYPLSNTHVLKQQVLEASELTVPVEFTINAVNLEELIKELEKALDLEEFQKEIEGLNAGIDVLKEVEKLVENIVKTIDQYLSKYKPALESYQGAYTEFEQKTATYIQALKELEAAKESPASVGQGSTEQDRERAEAQRRSKIAEKQAAVEQAKNGLESAISAYKSSAETLKTELSEMKDCADSLLTCMENVPAKLQKFESKISASSVAGDCTTSAYEWVLMIVNQATTMINGSLGGDAYRDKANEEIRLLGEQIVKLGNVSADMFSISWDTSQIYGKYGPIDMTTFGENFIGQLTELMENLNHAASLSEEGQTRLEALLMIAKELIGINGIYDENLDSVVSSASLYTPTYMSMSGQLSVGSLTSLITACENFTSGMTSLNILKALSSIIAFFEAVVYFLGAVLAWAAEVVTNVIGYVASGLNEMYNSLLLYGYSAYNLSNRTTVYSKKSLNEYSFKNIFDKAGGQYSAESIKGSLAELASFGNTEGSDTMFKGAEGEYILVGSKSELQNQAVAFFDLYLFRLLLDIVQVFNCSEVTAVASMAGPCALVVKILVALAEPMLDTIVLVNGGKEFLIKKTIYFSSAGLVALQKDLIGITSIAKSMQDKIKDFIKSQNQGVEEEGFFDLSYNEYLLLLTMLMVNQESYMQRLRNVIQMEAVKEYEGQYEFDLDHTFTYIDSNTTYTLNPMLKLDGLNAQGLFTATVKRCSGY